MSAAQVPVHDIGQLKRDVAFAWLSLGLYPASFGAAFLVGEGLATWLFDWPDQADPAPWQLLAVAVPAVLVFALPVIPAWHFGMRAYSHGSLSSRGAAWIAVAVAAAFAVVNVVSYVNG